MKEYIKENQVKQHLKEQQTSLGNTFLIALNQEIEQLINKAIKRAKNNGRKTVYERDL